MISPYVGLFPDRFAKIYILFLGQATCGRTNGTTYHGACHRISAENSTAHSTNTCANTGTAECALTRTVTASGQNRKYCYHRSGIFRRGHTKLHGWGL
jgi:hypothetical protein